MGKCRGPLCPLHKGVKFIFSGQPPVKLGAKYAADRVGGTGLLVLPEVGMRKHTVRMPKAYG